MMLYCKMYLIALGIFLSLDLIWLGLIAKNYYHQQLEHLLAPSFSVLPAVVFYLIFILGLVYFVIVPNFEVRDFNKLLRDAAFLGFLTYATYDLTNAATLKNWSWQITILDLAWGTCLSTLVCCGTYWILTKII